MPSSCIHLDPNGNPMSRFPPTIQSRNTESGVVDHIPLAYHTTTQLTAVHPGDSNPIRKVSEAPSRSLSLFSAVSLARTVTLTWSPHCSWQVSSSTFRLSTTATLGGGQATCTAHPGHSGSLVPSRADISLEPYRSVCEPTLRQSLLWGLRGVALWLV
jgi:hypothetical protein